MNAILNTLDDLAYILECAALDYMGEGKTELSRLCDRIEHDPGYAFEGREQILLTLRGALVCYKEGNKMDGASRLSEVSRSLWRLAKST